jgi:hypothetical protein
LGTGYAVHQIGGQLPVWRGKGKHCVSEGSFARVEQCNGIKTAHGSCGFAGCSSAEMLSNIKGAKITLVEKSNFLGSGVRTFFYGGHPYTFGPRHFLTKKKETYDYLRRFLKLRNCNYHQFKSYVEADNQFYNYPLNTTDIEKKDEKYWGHPIEFFAITNEFLEGLVLEFERRKNNLRNPENIKYLDKSFNNILNYFAKGEKLSKLSLDILSRINDEHVSDTAISKVVADIQTQYPNVEFSKQTKDEKPYYLILIELIKKYNPKIWPRFLTMLFKIKDEIQEILNKKEGI